jgi:hypothetical protein
VKGNIQEYTLTSSELVRHKLREGEGGEGEGEGEGIWLFGKRR